MTIEQEKQTTIRFTPQPEDSGYDACTAKEFIQNGIEAKRTEKISVSGLLLEESIVDDDHVEKLKMSMRGKRGQISPITVRARIGEGGDVVYDIIDGFHRGAALKSMAEEDGIEAYVDAVVVYGCSDEELFDLRVLAVNSVRSVSFARLSSWMQGSFDKSEWSTKDLTLSQIMSLAVTGSSGKNLGLTPDDAKRAKEWAREKSKKWNKPITSLYQDILAVENADPELVKRVRVGSGGSHGKSGVINPARFRAIVEELPQEFELQQKAAKVIMDEDLDKEESRLVAKAISLHRANEKELRLLKKDPRGYIGEVETENGKDDDVDVIHNSTQQGKFRKHHLMSSGKESDSYDKRTQKSLDDQIVSLQALLAKQQETSAPDASNWYELISDLTLLEREVMIEFFRDGLDPDVIGDRHGFVTHRVYLLLQSAHKKYQLSKEKQKLNKIMASFVNK
jgi:hypothetical protein